MIYYLINVMYSWVLVGAFCLAIEVSISNVLSKMDPSGTDGSLRQFAAAIILIYVIILLIIFIISLSVKPKRVQDLYKAIVFILGIYQIFIIIIIIFYLLRYGSALAMIILGSTALSFALIVIINCEIKTILFGVFHYLFLVPTYINIFLIYSICNVHDCTWGNRPDMLNEEEKENLEEFEEYRAKWVIIWVLCNSGFSYFLILINKSPYNGSYYLYTVTGIGIMILFIRFLGGVFYVINECCQKKLKDKEIIQRTENRPAEESKNQNPLERRESTRGIWVNNVEIEIKDNNLEQKNKDLNETKVVIEQDSSEFSPLKLK